MYQLRAATEHQWKMAGTMTKRQWKSLSWRVFKKRVVLGLCPSYLVIPLIYLRSRIEVPQFLIMVVCFLVITFHNWIPRTLDCLIAGFFLDSCSYILKLKSQDSSLWYVSLASRLWYCVFSRSLSLSLS